MRKSILSIFLLLAMGSMAQTDSTAVKDIDPSKPTNLYTQVNFNAEYTSADGYELMGVRGNVQYAFNPNNLALVELPVLYNSGTEKFGLADVRVRYFNKFKENANARISALVAGIDVTLPTGSYADRLGGGSFSIAPTFIAGVKITKKVFAFPGVSYVHITAPDVGNEFITSYASNGFGLQGNVSIAFSKRTFLFANPIYTYLNTNGRDQSIWTGELNLNHVLKPNKLKVNVGWFPNFTTEANTFRAGCTVFL